MGDEGDDLFTIKLIRFNGKTVPTLCQNQNGPCPLLAIANVLLLRGHLCLDHTLKVVPLSQIISKTGSLITSRNQTGLADVQLGGNFQCTIDEALKLLPSLKSGLDVNCKFTSPTAFEYTEGLTFFDLLDITLCHGWVVSSNDDETYPVVYPLSYNQLVEKVIVYRELCLNCDSIAKERDDLDRATLDEMRSHARIFNGNDLSPVTHTSPSKDVTTAILPTRRRHSETLTSLLVKPLPRSSSWAPERNLDLTEQKAMSGDNRPHASRDGDQALSTQQHQLSRAEIQSLLFEGQVLLRLVTEDAAQLTFEGLLQIHECLKEGELAILFRNNHFSTIHKINHKLYLLASDIGFSDMRDVVWERLDQVDGNTVYCNEQFQIPQDVPSKPRLPSSASTGTYQQHKQPQEAQGTRTLVSNVSKKEAVAQCAQRIPRETRALSGKKSRKKCFVM
eukprot:GHVN01096900.1.p1 GENE.GHVN01096900.1~~GHVN01096900.1.p1  ORF type:complete len:448 (+),score=35.28 GHVN01096900.1:790-2133(+)